MTTLATPLTVPATATAPATLATGKHTAVDATSGALTMTLPTPANVGARLRVEKVDASANAVNVTGTIRGVGSSTISLVGQYESIELFAETLTSWRPAAGHKTKAMLDAAYGRVETVNTVASSGAALTLPDVTTATIHDVTLTAACTVTFPALGAGKSFTVRLTQDATGSRLVTWPASVKWPGGTAPTLSTVAGKQDIISFVSIGGTTWSGFVAGIDLR